MAVVRWEPFRELAALQNEMGRWLGPLTGGGGPGNGQSSTWIPAVDVWETEGELVLSFDLPGLDEAKIAVEVEDSILTVSGQREKTNEYSGEQYYRFERRYGTFQRSVTLPAGVDETKIAASYRDGVLEVRVPKPEAAKPKRIQIGTSGTIEGEAKSAA